MLILFIVRLEHPAEEQWPSNSDQKSSSFEAASSKKLKSEQTSPRSGRMAWPDETRQFDSSDKDEKTKVGEGGKQKKRRRRRRRKQKHVVDQDVDVVRQSWKRGETSSSASSGNSRENNGRGPVERDTVETVIEAEKGGNGESDGCRLSKEDGDAFDAGIGLDLAAGRRALRMKRSFATTGDSSDREVAKIEDKLNEEDRSVSSSCSKEEEEKSRLLGGNLERAAVHKCSDQEVLVSISTSEEQAEKGFEIGGSCLLIPGSSGTARVENESEKDILASDLEEETSKCSLGVVAMGANDVMSAQEKEDELFDPPSTEILDYKSILSALKEKHREQQRKLREEAPSPLFWPQTGL